MALSTLNPTYPANSLSPLGFCSIDATSGLVYSPGCANYTPLSTTGTATIDSSGGGILYGVNAISTGTSWTITPYDIYVLGTTTTTNQLTATQTATAVGFQGNPGSGGTGVRYNGSLVVVTTGTGGLWNILWD